MDITQFQEPKQKAEKFIIIGGVLLVITVILFFLMKDHVSINGNQIQLLFIPGFIGVIIVLIGLTKYSKVNSDFKHHIIPKLVNSVLEDATYKPQNGLTQSQVLDSGFLKRPDRFKSEDYIQGTINNVTFISSDIKLQERRTTHTKNGTRTKYVTYFLGRLFKFDFNKSFQGSLQVLEKGWPRNRLHYKKQKLESIAFNKCFKTYSTNEHTTFYVLTPHLMEELVEFEHQNPGDISFSFINNHLYVGINNQKDTFELKLFRKIDNHIMKEFENDILIIKKLVRELKLNKNIFKKE
ncbi:MAG: DUF3137 domain-containing protein [Candidatus Izimaplasma sp.]|nr:DUF3137 domain-containing protein [Candidatus Izimaplasma bacterium]